MVEPKCQTSSCVHGYPHDTQCWIPEVLALVLISSFVGATTPENRTAEPGKPLRKISTTTNNQSTICSNPPMAWHYSWYLFLLCPPVSSSRVFIYTRTYVVAFRGHVEACGCFAYPPSTRAARNSSSYVWVGLCIRKAVQGNGTSTCF